jgi:thiol-disulfide isomerase/thioredoxin
MVTVGLVVVLLGAACSSGTSDSGPSTTVVDGTTADSATDSVDGSGADRPEPFDGTFTYEGESPAPEFPTGLAWLNVDRPLSLAQDLRGKIVVLDFWTQGCINCIHVIPDLARLEEEYSEELVVVGVHWAKFDRERQLEAVRQSVQRYGVEYPIVNDELEQIRAAYQVTAWPTLMLVGARGNVVGTHAGEGAYAVLQPVIDVMAAEFTAAQLIDPTPLDTVLEKGNGAPTVLSFPGKVLADGVGWRLFVADSGHHRILVSDLEGGLEMAIGSGVAGFSDGDFTDASFSRPQGMALSEDGNVLFIADRENHATRAADLRPGEVSTIAGTGEPVTRFEAGVGTDVVIASPWDLHREGDQLFIPGAGRHQLWVLELDSGLIDVFAGTGAEGIVDGHRRQSTLSQPSGFASDGEWLYFTDPEASAVRRVTLDARSQMETLVGDGLFSWGDETGTFDYAQLQHAIGIEYSDGFLYVADTYNHRLKVFDLANQTVFGLGGDGEAGIVDGALQESRFAEPSGLSIADGHVNVADTNNHQIRVIDMQGATVDTLTFTNLNIATLRHATSSGDRVVVAPIQVAPGRVDLVVNYSVPEGYKFNSAGTFHLKWSAEEGAVLAAVGASIYEALGPEMPVEVVVGAGSVIDVEHDLPPLETIERRIGSSG